MKSITMTSGILCLLLLTAGSLFGQDNETKIARKNLPPAVQKTVDAQSAGATVRGFSKEIDKGHTYYEADLLVNGHSKDILMDGDGKVVEVEEAVPLDSLPSAVKEALQANAGDGKITKVESLTKAGRLVAYEAQVKKGAKRSEIQVGPSGETLQHEE